MDKDVAKALSRIENELIDSMIRNLSNHRAQETKEGLNWRQWQVEQMAALQEYKEHAIKKYGIKFSRINDKLKLALKKSYEEGQNEEEIKMLEAMLKGVKVQQESSFFTASANNIDSMIEAISNDFIVAEHALLRRSEDIYRHTILNAQFYAVSGAGTYEKAVDMATRDFLRKGIDCIQYKNGRRMNISAYSEMALRTGSKRAALMGQGTKRKEWGHSLVIINKRGNACPLCTPFVGKVLIDDVYSGGKSSDGPYSLLSSAMSAGLYHPNCKDGHSTFFPELHGLDNQKLSEYDIDNIKKEALNEERIKYCDRKIEEFSRKEKYFLDSDNKKVAKARLTDWKEKKIFYENNSTFEDDEISKKLISFNPEVLTESDYESFSIECNKLCTPNELKVINRHLKPDGSIGGYFQTPNSFKINRALMENDFRDLDSDDLDVVEKLRLIVPRVKTSKDYMLYRFDNIDCLSQYFTTSLDELAEQENPINKDIEINKMLSTSMIESNNLFKSRPVKWEIKAPKGSSIFANGFVPESEALIVEKSKIRVLNIIEVGDKIIIEALLL